MSYYETKRKQRAAAERGAALRTGREESIAGTICRLGRNVDGALYYWRAHCLRVADDVLAAIPDSDAAMRMREDFEGAQLPPLATWLGVLK